MTMKSPAAARPRTSLIPKRQEYLCWLGQYRFLDYTRMNKLYRAKHGADIKESTWRLDMRTLRAKGYLRPVSRGPMAHPVYYLWTEGVRFLMEEDYPTKEKSPMTIDHDLVVSDIHMALNERANEFGVSIPVWEQRRSRLLDNPRDQYGQVLMEGHRRLSINPDLFVGIQHQNKTTWFYGDPTRHDSTKFGINDVILKMMAYSAYKKSGQHREFLAKSLGVDVPDFFVFFTLPSETQARNMALKARHELAKGHSRFLFTSEAEILADPYGKIFLDPLSVDPKSDNFGDKYSLLD
jgi:hypothetical protein